MSDLIHKAELFNKLAGVKAPPEANEYKAEVYRVIQSLPTEETQQGEWIPLAMNGEYKCSVCGCASKSDNAAWVHIPTAYWNYCPNCGADMRGSK